MPLYRLAGSVLRSNVSLPELSPGDGQPEWHLEFLPACVPEAYPCEWFHHWCGTGGEMWLCLGRKGSDYLLRFVDLADFQVCLENRRIQCSPSQAVPPETLRHLVLDQVFPLLLSQRGEMVLHASAVVSPAGAIAFVGRTGLGKSTLAAYLAVNGFPLLTDDCLIIEHHDDYLCGYPLYPGLRLLPDAVRSVLNNLVGTEPSAAYSQKRRLGPDQSTIRFHAGPAPVARIYFLDATHSSSSGYTSITPVSPRDAFVKLLHFTFLMDVTEPETLMREFQWLSRAATSTQYHQLSFRRDFRTLPEVRERILRDLANS